MRFEILEIPGSGAHAAVCLAREPGRQRPIALKVLFAEFSADSAEAKRARDEARLLKNLDHPNIVRLHERLVVDGRDVLAMEWVEGPDLGKLVRRLGRIPPRVALQICRRAADAAAYAYAVELEGRPLRLVHRDLTLHNMLLSIRGEVKILDYGLAKAEFDGRETDTQYTLKGSRGYVAPEGLQAMEDNPGLDVYSLGICLYYMASGHLPVLSRQRMAHDSGLAEQHTWLVEELQGRGTYVEGLEALLKDLCAFEPADRPTMTEVIARIDAIDPEPVDLVAWADAHVHPIHIGRRRVDVREHEAYRTLAFLEVASPSEELTHPGGDPDSLLRAFLKKGDWPKRGKELSQLLARNPLWTPAPFLEVLEGHDLPWWNFWKKRPSRSKTRSALRMLAHRPCDEVETAARMLSRHRDPSIRKLAQAILSGDDVTLSE